MAVKILVTLIAVIALAAPVFAQVDVTITDNGGGSITIGYSGASEDLAGVSMIVTLSGGDGALADCADAVQNGPFNTAIDFYHTTGGTPVLGDGCPVGAVGSPGLPTFPATSFAISTGVLLDPPGGAPAPSGDICTIQLSGTGCTTVTLMDDNDRGTIVGTSTNALAVSYPADLEVCFDGPCGCLGDSTGPLGVPDGLVSTSDMSDLLAIIGPAPGFTVTPVPAGKECLDNSGPAGVPDGTLSTSDMGAILAHIGPLPGFVGPCID